MAGNSEANQDMRLKRVQPNQSPKPVDGRWAVVVLIAAFIGRAIVSMQSTSMPMLTVEWEKRLGATPSQVSWATTLVVAPRFLIAPVAGALIRRFGCRPVVFAGGILSMILIILMSVTTKLWQIFICCSIIGMSMGLVYQGIIIVVSVYFDKWLGRANGFAFSGVGIGLMAGSPLVALLIDVFTWRGALLVMAGIVANLSVAAAVYRPLSWWAHKPSVTIINDKVGRQQMSSCEENINSSNEEMQTINNVCNVEGISNRMKHEETVGLQPLVSEVTPVDIEVPFQDVRRSPEDIVMYSTSECGRVDDREHDIKRGVQRSEVTEQFQTKFLPHHHNAYTRLTCFVNVRLFVKNSLDLFGFTLIWTNSNVRLLCLLSIFQGAGYFTPFLYLPSYIVSSGVSEFRASLILTILGSCSLVSRLAHGFLIDYNLTTPPKLFGFTSIIAACSCYVIVFSRAYEAFVIFAVFYGLSTGTLIPLCPVMTKKYTAPSQLANAFALQSLFLGISKLLGTYMLELIFEGTKNYRLCFCLAGALLCTCGVFGFLIEPWNRRKHRHRLRIQ